MNEQPQDSQPAHADVDPSLTPGDQTAGGQRPQPAAASDDDTHGYLVGIVHFSPYPPLRIPGEGPTRPVGSYPPGVRTDASR